ncbi:MAG: S8 family serine peptidase [Elusimicrobiota bacterium]
MVILKAIKNYKLKIKNCGLFLTFIFHFSFFIFHCLYCYQKASIFIPSISKSVDVAGGEIIVRVKESVDINIINTKYDTKTIQDMKFNNVFRVSIPDGSSIQDMVSMLSADPDVVYAEPNYLMKAYQVNDSSYSAQWALPDDKYLDWYDAWTSSNTLFSKGVTTSIIAVIDSGVDWRHPDLEANIYLNTKDTYGNKIDDDNNGYIEDYYGVNILYGQDAPNSNLEEEYGDPRPIDTVGHGTHVAGIAAAVVNNSTGIAGVSWTSKIMIVKIFDANAFRTGATASNIAAGIKYAVDNGADVLNLSLGGYIQSRFVKDAVDYTVDKNVVIVASAGNDGINSISYPAGYDGVISVGASDIYDERVSEVNGYSWGSNYGIKLDLLAPGASVYSTYAEYSWSDSENDWKRNSSYYEFEDGTSMASPYVAGVCGLLISQNPARTPADIKKILEASCDNLDVPGWDKYTGWGRLNVYKALSGNLATAWTAPLKVKNYPNPFYPRKHEFVTIRLPEKYRGSEFNVTIYNLAAMPVRYLKHITNEISVDNGLAVWDGKNDNGDLVASGLYYYVVDIGSKKVRGKITLIK